MSTRPLSERHHDLPPLDAVHEVRVWDESGWRTLCCCALPEDAALVASAIVSSADHPVEFAEVWAPSGTSGGPRRSWTGSPRPLRRRSRTCGAVRSTRTTPRRTSI